MPQFYDAGETTRPTHERGPKSPALRTYRQIAAILAAREGTSISPARVRQMCQAAERRFARALLADPVFHEWLGRIAGWVH